MKPKVFYKFNSLKAMANNSYFQFPLCVLSLFASEKERLNMVIYYGTMETGLKFWAKLSYEEKTAWLEKYKSTHKMPLDFDPNDNFHGAALYGTEVIGITFGEIEPFIDRCDKMRLYVRHFESNHGRDVRVRIKRNWVFNARDHKGLTYREFSVLCGIYSAIGTKQLARITQDRIGRCSLGYRTAAIMKAELGNRTDGSVPLTVRQIRDTISRLHRNKFFARSTFARRITYYSIRLDGEALRKKILEMHTYPDFFRSSQAALDQTMTAVIQNRRLEAIQLSQNRVP